MLALAWRPSSTSSRALFEKFRKAKYELKVNSSKANCFDSTYLLASLEHVQIHTDTRHAPLAAQD